ncbi:MAG TPA: FG-GAP-like repeat-containing protein [Bryobacteraceae bacterium]|jgi:hypothetical protein|nr:FG-GAP-like repeat-containing protein [Bryobacteraceae bacterium]
MATAYRTLAFVNGINANIVSILLGNGNGSFQPPVDYAAGGWGLAAADFNGDGILDLVSRRGRYPARNNLGVVGHRHWDV